MVSKSRGRFATFDPKEHLNLSNLPCIILSAISAGDAGSRLAMSLKRSSKSCCTRISIKADPTGLPYDSRNVREVFFNRGYLLTFDSEQGLQLGWFALRGQQFEHIYILVRSACLITRGRS